MKSFAGKMLFWFIGSFVAGSFLILYACTDQADQRALESSSQ